MHLLFLRKYTVSMCDIWSKQVCAKRGKRTSRSRFFAVSSQNAGVGIVRCDDKKNGQGNSPLSQSDITLAVICDKPVSSVVIPFFYFTLKWTKWNEWQNIKWSNMVFLISQNLQMVFSYFYINGSDNTFLNTLNSMTYNTILINSLHLHWKYIYHKTNWLSNLSKTAGKLHFLILHQSCGSDKTFLNILNSITYKTILTISYFSILGSDLILWKQGLKGCIREPAFDQNTARNSGKC